MITRRQALLGIACVAAFPAVISSEPAQLPPQKPFRPARLDRLWYAECGITIGASDMPLLNEIIDRWRV